MSLNDSHPNFLDYFGPKIKYVLITGDNGKEIILLLSFLNAYNMAGHVVLLFQIKFYFRIIGPIWCTFGPI